MKLIVLRQKFEDAEPEEVCINPFQVAFIEPQNGGNNAAVTFVGGMTIIVADGYYQVLSQLADAN